MMSKQINNRFSSAAFAALPLLTAATTWASGGEAPAGGAEGAGHHGAPHVTNWTSFDKDLNHHAPALAWVMVTFAVFAAVIIIFVRKPMRGFLATRSDEIANAIKEAEIAKKKAEEKQREYEKKLAALDGEAAAMRRDFQQRGEEEKQRLIRSGEKTAERFHQDAKDTMQAELTRTRHSLAGEASILAIALAEKRIKSAINADDETRMQKDFLAQIAAS